MHPDWGGAEPAKPHFRIGQKTVTALLNPGEPFFLGAKRLYRRN